MEGNDVMRHVRPVTIRRPARAQFEPLLQLLGVIQVALNLLVQLSQVFGFEIPQKGDEP